MTDDVKRTPANDNPYYRMMTLYGEQEGDRFDRELHAKNRRAWNRWMASELTDEQCTELREKGFSQEELTPFDDTERAELLADYRKRGGGDAADLPEPNTLILDFSNVQFDKYFCAEKLIFANWADFKGASFAGRANFQGASFAGRADFEGASFADWADFEGASFASRADFEGASFAHWANFQGSSFADMADFQGASFAGWADFKGASFADWADFQGATFGAILRLNQVKFQTAPPQFFDADLKQATFFHGVKWPDPPNDIEKATNHADAYQRLRLFMDEQKRTRDELDFFILEMKCRRRSFKFPEKIASYLFEWTSDFGRSLARPALGMLLTVLLCLFFYYAALPDVGYMTTNSQCLAPSPTTACPADTLRFTSDTSALERIQIAFSLSGANTFRVFGGGFVFADEIKSLSFGLRALGLFQSFFGTVFLGLLGLGLRNRFRLH